MAVSKARKVEQLAQLEAHLKDAKSVGFTSNTKITVAEVTAIKRDLIPHNAIYLTAKKTLIRIAFKNVFGLDLDIDAPLGVVNKYASQKDWKKAQKLTFVGGYFEEKIVDADSIRKIASLPSREVLLAKLLSSMMAPLSSLARFFDAAKKDLEAKNLSTVKDLEVPAIAEETSAEEKGE